MRKIAFTLTLLFTGFLLHFDSRSVAQTRGEASGCQSVVKIISNRLETKDENYTTFYRNCIKTTYDCMGSGDLSCPESGQETCTDWSPNVP